MKFVVKLTTYWTLILTQESCFERWRRSSIYVTNRKMKIKAQRSLLKSDNTVLSCRLCGWIQGSTTAPSRGNAQNDAFTLYMMGGRFQVIQMLYSCTCLTNWFVVFSPCCFLSTPLSPALSLPSLPALLSFRYLKPDENKKSKHKTAVKKKTLNPEFNEVKSTTMALLLQIHFGFLSPPQPKSSVYPVLSHLHNPETYQSHSERAQLSHRKGEPLSKFIPRWLFERAAELNRLICWKSFMFPTKD